MRVLKFDQAHKNLEERVEDLYHFRPYKVIVLTVSNTAIKQRYLPAETCDAGTYAFQLLV